MNFNHMGIKIGVAILSCAMAVGGFTGCKKNTSTELVVTINDYEVYMDEAIWYLYLMEKDLKDDADLYYQMNEESYWTLDMGTGNTVAEAIKEEIINNIVYYEILSNQAEKTGDFTVEVDDGGYKQEAEAMMKEINEDLQKEGLTQEGYEKVLAKIGQTDLYYDAVIQLYEVDQEAIKEENPYSEEEYSNMAEYNDFIESLVISEKENMFYEEYLVLLEQYDVEINDKVWDKIVVGELAELIE